MTAKSVDPNGGSEKCPHYCLDSEVPPIVGLPCSGFHLQRLRDDNRTTDPAHILHLKFGEVWYRFFIESTLPICIAGGETSDDGYDYVVDAEQLDELSAAFPLGDTLVALAAANVGQEVQITFEFANQCIVILRKDINETWCELVIEHADGRATRTKGPQEE